jgi:hypothetical protein
MAIQTRVPSSPNIDEATRTWMDMIERRQIAMGQVTDPPTSATLADLIAKVSEMLATQRTR